MKLTMMLVLLVQSLFAAGPGVQNPLRMISGGKAAMISYALSETEEARAEVYANAPVPAGTKPDGYAEVYADGETDGLKVIGKLRTERLDYAVARPYQDWVGLEVRALNDEGQTLLYGGNSKQLELRDGQWQVPGDLFNFSLYLWWEFPIRMKGVVDAKLILRDEDNNVSQYVELDLSQNGFMFQTQYLGRNGDIAVTQETPEGYVTWVSTLRENAISAVESGSLTGVSPNVDGVWDYDTGLEDSRCLIFTLWADENGYGESPLLRFTTAGGSYLLGLSATSGEVPLGYMVKSVDNPQESYYFPNTGDLTEVRFARPGKWEVIIDWHRFDGQFNGWGGKG